MIKLTPSGVSDLTPTHAKRYNWLISSLENSFEQEGYAKVRTPSLEYLDALSPGLGPNLMSSAIKFLGPEDTLMVLRPDHTTPIARLVATQMQADPLPLKLYYSSPVYRQANTHRHEIEVFQAGCEYIGDASADADALILAECTKAIESLTNRHCHLSVNHVDTVSTYSPEQKQALLDGDFVRFGSIPKRGGPNTLDDSPSLQTLHQAIDKQSLSASICYDRSLIKALSYYTGMIFECYIEGVRKPVAMGGRYDNLLGKYGYPNPAVGFMIDVTTLYQAGFGHD